MKHNFLSIFLKQVIMAKRKMTRTSNFPKVLKTNLKTSEEVVRINNETKFFNNFDEFLNKIEADRNQVS